MFGDLALVLCSPHLSGLMCAERKPLSAYFLLIVAETLYLVAVTLRPYPDYTSERSIACKPCDQLVPVCIAQLLLLRRQDMILLRYGYRYQILVKIKIVIWIVSSRN